MVSALYFLGIVAVIFVGFVLLDRWHMRHARREAERMARRYMDGRDRR